jgi:23S rRNA-/tRNA-specific pseudouridylate synthase
LYKLFRQRTVRVFNPDSASIKKISKISPLSPGCQLLIPKNTFAVEFFDKGGYEDAERNSRKEGSSSSSSSSSSSELSPWHFKQKLHWLHQLRSSVIYKDQDMIVLNKPPNIAVQGGSKILYSIDYLKEEAFHNDDDDASSSRELRLVHRLDAQTSGCFILARHVDAASWLSRAFRAPHAIRKQYWAIVDTSHHNGSFAIPDVAVGTHGVVELPGEMTRYTILAVNTQAKLALLEMYPVTGRKHQLRRHAALQLGASILGDDKYERALVEGRGERGEGGPDGDDDNDDGAGGGYGSHLKREAMMVKDRVRSKGRRRMYLHCLSLTIHNNSSGGAGGAGGRDVLRITAPPPSYWSSLFHKMGWNMPSV